MNAFGGLLSSTCGALLTAMPVSRRGRSAGWYQGGNMAGGCMGGGLFLWLGDHASLPVLAVVIAINGTAGASGPFYRRNRARSSGNRPAARRPRSRSGRTFSCAPDMARTGLLPLARRDLRHRQCGVGIGSGLPCLGERSAVGDRIGWGLLAALGCFVGGVVADRMNRMVAFALAGGFSAASAFTWDSLRPHPSRTRWPFGLRDRAGIRYGRVHRVGARCRGEPQHAAASGYAALNSAGNVPVTYMTWLDGVGYKHRGRTGMMATDAAANSIFGIILLLVAMFAGRHWRHRGKRGFDCESLITATNMRNHSKPASRDPCR